MVSYQVINIVINHIFEILSIGAKMVIASLLEMETILEALHWWPRIRKFDQIALLSKEIIDQK